MSVLVTDGDSRAALAAVRALGRAGISVTACASEPVSMAGRSRFCGKMIRYPSPWDDPEGFQEFLHTESHREGCRLLLPITDITMQLAAQTRESLAPAVRAALPSEEQVRRVQDKRYVLELAKQLNIACPATHFMDDGSSVYEVAQRIRYPAVLKPRISRFRTNEGWVRGTVEYTQDPDDLVKKYQASHARIPYPLIQERIDGEGRGVFLLLWNGKVKAAFCHRRLLEKPPSGGVSVLCESIPLDEHLVEKSLLLLNAMDWQGPAMVEFKVDRQTGQANLMEVNGRFWGSLQLAIDAGMNFPVLLYRLANGEDPAAQFEYKAGVKSRWLIGYLDHLLLRVTTKQRSPDSIGPRGSKFRAFLKLLNFFEPNLHDAILRFNDVRPFVFECKTYARNRLRQLGHRNQRGDSKNRRCQAEEGCGKAGQDGTRPKERIMSRNYELLTQAERGHELFQTPPPPLPPAVQNALAQAAQPTLEGIPAAGSPDSRPRTGWREKMRGGNHADNGGIFSHGRRTARRLDIESLTWQEELKLVQRLFLGPEAATRKVVAFVGAEEGDGSNRVCARSAEILASQVKGTVCVVDANLRAPSLHLHFKTDNTKGFTEAALQTGPVTAFVKQFAATNLWLMTAGTLSAATNLVLPVDLVRARVEQLRAEFDHVLIHTGPVTQDASSLLLGQLADGVVLVVRAHRTRRAKALEARQRLQSAAARLLGTVLDQRTFPIPEPLYSRL